MEQRIQILTEQRDALTSQIRAALNAAAFEDAPLDERVARDWIARGHNLLLDAARLGM